MDDLPSASTIRRWLIVALIVGAVIGWVTAPLTWMPGIGYVWLGQ